VGNLWQVNEERGVVAKLFERKSLKIDSNKNEPKRISGP
jgi:hypothetical protein